jgi:hypothetical protein
VSSRAKQIPQEPELSTTQKSPNPSTQQIWANETKKAQPTGRVVWVFFLQEICVDLQILPAIFLPSDFPQCNTTCHPTQEYLSIPHVHLVENFSIKSLSCDDKIWLGDQLYYYVS